MNLGLICFPDNSRIYCTKHSLHFPQNLVIPESQHTKPFPLQMLLTHSVIGHLIHFGMMTAIQFDDQFMSEGNKIGNVGADGGLAAEFAAALLATKMKPQPTLGIGHVLAQMTRIFFD